MVQGPIEAVILDLGNVLISFDHRIAARKIAKFTDKTPQQIYDLFFDSRETALFETGDISPEDFFTKVKERLGLDLDYEGFLPIWNDIFFLSSDNLAVYSLAKAIKGRYKLALLSNINSLHLEYIRSRFSILDIFSVVIASCDVGTRKPDPAIYRKALQALGTEPANTFYTDDRPELIAGADLLGIKGFVFKGVEKLRADMRGCGITLGRSI